MDFNYKQWGNICIDSIKQKLKGLDWDKYTFRQDSYSVHRQTKTVPLIWHENDKNIKCDTLQLFESEISTLSEYLNINIGTGYLYSAILINLPAKSYIRTHIDAAYIFKLSSRLHIPIITNDKCIFIVDNEKKQMKPGEIWEINNDLKSHSVKNDGDDDRIHLLIDYRINK